MITRYVNAANTPGGTGQTADTGGANRACATTAAAIATCVSGGALTDHVQVYQTGSAPENTSLDHEPMEFTTTTANYLEIFGNNTTGKWNTSAHRFEITDSSGLYNQYASHVRLYNVQMMVRITTGGRVNAMRLSTANNDLSFGAPFFLFKGCIVRKDPTSTSGDVDGFSNSISGSGAGGGVLYIVNSVVYDCLNGSLTDGGAWVAANVRAYNNTMYGNTFGFQDDQVCVNNVAVENSGGDFLGTGTTGHSHNSSSDTSAGGTSALTNQSYTFIDAANDDFRLASGDPRDNGLSDPGSGLFSDDVLGNTRTGTWDRGFHEFGAGGGSQQAAFRMRFRRQY